MTPAIVVGNDVVDLAAPRTSGKASDQRFVQRVFATDEREAIASAADADLELWCRWAAKEAGYKVVSKLLGTPPPFVHQAFHVVWAHSDDALPETETEATVRTGTVSYEPPREGPGHGLEALLTVGLCRDALHAFGFGGRRGVPPLRVPLESRVARLDERGAPWSGSTERLTERLSPKERDAVYSRASAAVRLGARAHLAAALGIEEARIEIVCAPGRTGQTPPRVLVDGERSAAADVSLSHDGRWIAWVISTG